MLANADTNFVNAKRYITTKYIFFPHFFLVCYILTGKRNYQFRCVACDACTTQSPVCVFFITFLHKTEHIFLIIDVTVWQWLFACEAVCITEWYEWAEPKKNLFRVFQHETSDINVSSCRKKRYKNLLIWKVSHSNFFSKRTLNFFSKFWLNKKNVCKPSNIKYYW